MGNDDNAQILINGNPVAFTDRPLAKMHKFYISGPIGEPSQYTQWFETIRCAGENDVVMFYINSPGGDLFTTLQFLRVIAESKAQIVASVEGMCMSAATLIFMAAKQWEISKHSMFMFHNYNSVVVGKGGEIYDQVFHYRSWSDALWRDSYKDFLTEEELRNMLHNKDIWLSGEEVEARLRKKISQSSIKASRKTAKKAAKKATTKKAAKKTTAKKRAK